MSRRRPRLHQKQNNHIHRWTVSYADYMTLMFALFVVLYAVSLNKEEKYQEIISAIQSASKFVQPTNSGSNATGILTKNSNDIKDNTGPALISDGDNYAQGYVSDLPVEQLSTRQIPAEQLSTPQGYYTGNALSELQLSLQAELETELEAGDLSVDLNGDWLTIEMKGPLLFAAESHTILNAAEQKIELIAAVLAPATNMIRLRGYTDLTNVSNELYQSNWELSALRAISVLHAFNARGIVGERMVIEGYGKFQPIIDSNGKVDPLNSRRVVIAISKFALYTDNSFGKDNMKSADKEQQKILRTPKPDSEEIREVYLPNGRLIITTRQE